MRSIGGLKGHSYLVWRDSHSRGASREDFRALEASLRETLPLVRERIAFAPERGEEGKQLDRSMSPQAAIDSIAGLSVSVI